MSIKPIAILQMVSLLLSIISLGYAIYVGHRLLPIKDPTLRDINSSTNVSHHGFANPANALKQLGFTDGQINNIRKNTITNRTNN